MKAIYDASYVVAIPRYKAGLGSFPGNGVLPVQKHREASIISR